jgi:DNA-binding response OmpR family regulator
MAAAAAPVARPEPSGPITAIPDWPDPDDVEGSPRVLVVDDDADSRLFCRTLLESRGWQVEEAADGATALLRLGKDQDWSLVVLDLGLPDIDGLHVLRGLRSTVRDYVPVMVLTGRADRDSELRAIQEGADDFIRKPIDPPIFLARSKAAWRRSRVS